MTDKLVRLSNRLKEVKKKFEALEKIGMDRELLLIYIQHKTKLSKGNVLKMLKAQKEFYAKLIKQEIVENL